MINTISQIVKKKVYKNDEQSKQKNYYILKNGIIKGQKNIFLFFFFYQLKFNKNY